MTTTPLHPLVPVLCDGLLGQPLAAILPPQLLCSLGQKAALLYLGSAQAEAHTQQAWQRVFALLAEGGTLRTRLPAPVVEVLNSLLLRPYLLPRRLRHAAACLVGWLARQLRRAPLPWARLRRG